MDLYNTKQLKAYLCLLLLVYNFLTLELEYRRWKSECEGMKCTQRQWNDDKKRKNILSKRRYNVSHTLFSHRFRVALY